MAQRGGSVTSHVRWGQAVYAPLIVPGEVDVLLAFERLEALRYVSLLRPHGTLLVNDYRIAPVSVSSGRAQYPSHEEEVQTYTEAGIRWALVPAIAIAQELGNARVNNIVLLGALAAQLDVPAETWRQVIAERVPARFVELNLAAFDRGLAYTAQPA
jgi:indolepyruvate ferredoxin oxidoreductase beta subunit